MPNQAVLLGSLTIPGEPAYLREARKLVARTLADGNADVDTAVLLTSELVTNSMQHSRSGRPGGTVTITVIAAPDGVRVEVIDDGGMTVPAVTVGQPGDPGFGEGGRGLRLVEVLSARWDYYSDPAGTATWFELTADPYGCPSGDPLSGSPAEASD
jgi:anti-sigma regulatory factor (Ser/Thr protein kinase)